MKSINCKGKLITFETPKVMGILNITPNSFFDGGWHHSLEKIEQQKQLLEQSLTELENNFNSLMQRAFKGELF